MFFFFRVLFCGKEATTTTKQTWKGKTISVDVFNLTLADYNKLRQGLVNKSKYKVKKKLRIWLQLS